MTHLTLILAFGLTSLIVKCSGGLPDVDGLANGVPVVKDLNVGGGKEKTEDKGLLKVVDTENLLGKDKNDGGGDDEGEPTCKKKCKEDEKDCTVCKTKDKDRKSDVENEETKERKENTEEKPKKK